MDDNELILRLQRDDESAFDTVFRTYYKWLCAFAKHYVRNHEAAEEIVEDFFCHFWENSHEFSINTSLKGYLFRSIHNRCLNYIRNEKVRKRYISENQYVFTDDELLSESVPAFYESETAVNELENNIGLAINELPGQCKTVFCMSRFEDLSYTEIANKLGISINTVKTQMTRALQKLRESLKDYLDSR
jgi:RNA polymerase sigma-70 factor (ECF subfamily)